MNSHPATLEQKNSKTQSTWVKETTEYLDRVCALSDIRKEINQIMEDDDITQTEKNILQLPQMTLLHTAIRYLTRTIRIHFTIIAKTDDKYRKQERNDYKE